MVATHIFLEFSPRKLGQWWTHFWVIFFQMGWNHQLETLLHPSNQMISLRILPPSSIPRSIPPHVNCCVWHLRNEVETHCLDLPPTNLLDRPDLMELLWFTAKDGKAWGFCRMFKGCNTGFWDFKVFLMSQADAARIWPNPSHHHYTGSTPWVRLATVSIQPWMYWFRHHPWSMTIDIYKSYMNKTYTTYNGTQHTSWKCFSATSHWPHLQRCFGKAIPAKMQQKWRRWVSFSMLNAVNSWCQCYTYNLRPLTK